MKTVRDVLLTFDEGLKSVYDPLEAASIKYLAVEYVSLFNKARLRAFPETELTPHQIDKLSEILLELQRGKPLQYVLGTTEFYGLPFKVSPAVLIPRPETEELVKWIIDAVKHQDGRHENILDIGTGSGCIPVALKKHLPDAKLSAIDISEDALSIARYNAEANQADVEFMCDNILRPVIHHHTAYSIIVSNPPYVTIQEKGAMHPNVLEYEPHLALFVSDDDPLVFYRSIADFASNQLQPNGSLFFEINENFGKQTVKLLHDKKFKEIELRKDIRGKDRMIRAIK